MFEKGNKLGGRYKHMNSRNKLTKEKLIRIDKRSEAGMSMPEIMMDIAQDPKQPSTLRLQAAIAVADLVYHSPSSVNLEVNKTEELSIEEIDERLKFLISEHNNKVSSSQYG